MTNHSGTTGPSENSDIPIQGGRDAAEPRRKAAAARTETPVPVSREDRPPLPPDLSCTAYESHGDPQQVTLRTPAELADAVPYLLGYRPEDSMVLVSLHDTGGRGRFGGRARLGIPADPGDWPSAARQLAQGLVAGCERRGSRPEQMVVFLCQEPGRGETGRQVKERLGPLAHALRLESGALDVPVVEALCVSDGRFWSYCCDDQTCCPAEGTPMGLPGTSVLAAAAAYAGLQVRGSLRELHARLQPWETSAAHDQRRALDEAGLKLLPRIVDAEARKIVADETLELAERLMRRLADAPPVSGALPADLRDDELVGYDEAAMVLLGLQDRTTRDRAAAWMEGDEAAPALRLWRTLARRCVGPYGSTPPRPSPSPGGSPGPPVTNWRPGRHWPWRSGPTRTISSRVCCTRRATRGSTRSRSAAACGARERARGVGRPGPRMRARTAARPRRARRPARTGARHPASTGARRTVMTRSPRPEGAGCGRPAARGGPLPGKRRGRTGATPAHVTGRGPAQRRHPPRRREPTRATPGEHAPRVTREAG